MMKYSGGDGGRVFDFFCFLALLMKSLNAESEILSFAVI